MDAESEDEKSKYPLLLFEERFDDIYCRVFVLYRGAGRNR